MKKFAKNLLNVNNETSSNTERREVIVGKCLDTAVTAMRSITIYCISMMFKEEGFYVQKMYSYINALNRIGISVCNVEVVSTQIKIENKVIRML